MRCNQVRHCMPSPSLYALCILQELLKILCNTFLRLLAASSKDVQHTYQAVQSNLQAHCAPANTEQPQRALCVPGNAKHVQSALCAAIDANQLQSALRTAGRYQAMRGAPRAANSSSTPLLHPCNAPSVCCRQTQSSMRRRRSSGTHPARRCPRPAMYTAWKPSWLQLVQIRRCARLLRFLPAARCECTFVQSTGQNSTRSACCGCYPAAR